MKVYSAVSLIKEEDMNKNELLNLVTILENSENDNELAIKQVQINDFTEFYNNMTTKQLLELDVRILPDIKEAILSLISEQNLSLVIHSDFACIKSDWFADDYI